MTTKSAIESCVISTVDGAIINTRIFRPTQDVSSSSSSTAVVLVHPYSKLGGNQALMHGIALRLSVKGFTAITFDLRGVGRSTGYSTLTGFAEINDVIAVCTWVSKNLPANSILLVGSSAGAAIAGSAVDQVEQVIGYVGVGYPFGLAVSILFGRHNKAILKSPKPKLFVLGTRDGLTSVWQLENKVKSAVGRAETHLIPGVGHFEMEGQTYDAQMVDLILGFLKSL